MKKTNKKWKRNLRRDWQLYLFLVLPLLYIVIFAYLPMGGLVMAFQDYKPRLGFLKSEWVGFDNFIKFIQSYNFKNVVGNTLILSLYSIVVTFPLPIIFALMINSIQNGKLAKITQTIVNLPHFISVTVLVGIIFQFFNSRTGIYGIAYEAITGEYPKDLFASAANFRHFYVWSAVWQNFGWDSIIYTAALSSVDTSYHEAAQIDGATRLQRVRHIDFPCIIPTVIINLILRMGSIMSIGFEKVFLLQNSLNLKTSEIVSTYVYQVGLSASGTSDFSYATAIGCFNSVVNLILICSVNKIASKYSETSLW